MFAWPIFLGGRSEKNAAEAVNALPRLLPSDRWLDDEFEQNMADLRQRLVNMERREKRRRRRRPRVVRRKRLEPVAVWMISEFSRQQPDTAPAVHEDSPDETELQKRCCATCVHWNAKDAGLNMFGNISSYFWPDHNNTCSGFEPMVWVEGDE